MLYDKMWFYYNFFQPVMRLSEKEAISESGTCRVKRRFDQPQTPFERLCTTGVLPEERREKLERLRQQTNPRRLRREIYDLLDYSFSLPGATPGVTENVLETLTMSIPAQKGEGSPVTLSLALTRQPVRLPPTHRYQVIQVILGDGAPLAEDSWQQLYQAERCP